MNHRRQQPEPIDLTTFTGYRFPPEVIMLTVRWFSDTNCPTATLKNSSQNAASKSFTSQSTDESNESLPHLSRPHDPAEACGSRWFVGET